MAFLSIQADTEEVQKALEGTSKSIKTISRKTLSIVARGTVKAIKGAISATTQRHTGELLKAYRYKVNKDGSGAKVFINGAKGSSIFPKVYTLNYGKDGTKWKPRSFVQSAEQYVQNGNYGPEIESVVQKELNKYWGG